MTLIEWEVSEDSYQEQIQIPEAQRKLADEAGIRTENKQQVAARIQNLAQGDLVLRERNELGSSSQNKKQFKRGIVWIF